jgi:hypothetical protein
MGIPTGLSINADATANRIDFQALPGPIGFPLFPVIRFSFFIFLIHQNLPGFKQAARPRPAAHLMIVFP